MGNPKFKLSDMIPNAWFYMLKDFNKSSNKLLKKHHPPPSSAPPSSPPIIPITTPPPKLQPEPQYEASRKSYHITRELPLSPPRKSKSSTKSRKSTRRSSSLSSCSCKSTITSHSHHSKSLSYSPSPSPLKETDENVGFFVEDALLTTQQAKQSILDNAMPNLNKGSAKHFDVIIDVDKESLRVNNNINKFNFPLPPIKTKQQTNPKNINKENKLKTNNPRTLKDHKYSPPSSRRLSVSSPRGVRLKINSPRVIGGARRSTSSKKKKKKSIAESFAVVKSSCDPQKDFKESMVEMIVQNNLRASKDLEDLLACYLSLNSDEYHEVIIKVFKQIWFDLRHP